MKPIDINAVRNGLLGQEQEYGYDWIQDAERLGRSGLYNTITKIVEPKPHEIIVDIGTGTGLQLVSIAGVERDVITIGTERTRANVLLTYQYLAELGLQDALSALSTSELAVTEDKKLFWKPEVATIAKHMAQVRTQLQEKIMLLEDNILTPALLPYVLEGKQIDAGILSMPGGSSSRLLEWPFDPMTLTQETKRERVYEISNQTRFAFYHFMSEHVRPGGRIVVAERMLSDPGMSPTVAVQMLTVSHMRGLHKYWEPVKGALHETEFTNTAVELSASNPHGGTIHGHAAEREGYTPNIAIIRYDRNDVPFEEAPLPRPEKA